VSASGGGGPNSSSTQGRIGAQDLLKAISACTYSSPDEIQRLLVRAFLLDINGGIDEHFTHGRLSKALERAVTSLLTYLYLESAFLTDPSAPLFRSLKLTESHPDVTKAVGRPRANSWDVTSFFTFDMNAGGGMAHNKDEQILSLRPLLNSLTIFLRTKTNPALSISSPTPPSLTDAVVQWLEDTLPCIPTVFTAAIRFHFVDPPFLRTRQQQRPSRDEDGQVVDEGILRSPSLGPVIRQSDGWKGIFLLGTSRVLPDEICCTLRHSEAKLNTHLWHRLFASWKNGLSFNRLTHHIVHYAGPSLIAVKTYDGQVFGAYCSQPWKESNTIYFGSMDSFIFAAIPSFHVYRCTNRSHNCFYLNSKNNYSPKGIAIGGTLECPRVWIREDFEDNHVTLSDATFATGPLVRDFAEFAPEQQDINNNSSDNNNNNNNDNNTNRTQAASAAPSVSAYDYMVKFRVQELEVWGAGGDDALVQQQHGQDSEQRVREQRRKVDKKQLVGTDFDKEFLLGKTFAGAKEAREDVSRER